MNSKLYADKPVLNMLIEWLISKNISYTVDKNKVIVNDFSIICIEKDNTEKVVAGTGEKIVFAHNTDRDIKRIESWLFKKPTLRIEKMNINMRDDGRFLFIEGSNKKTGELAVTSKFLKLDDRYVWLDLTYISNFVPGFISKCITMLNHKPIETFSFTEDNAFAKLGFVNLGETTGIEVSEVLGVDPRICYSNPETITLWKLKYDSNSTV